MEVTLLSERSIGGADLEKIGRILGLRPIEKSILSRFEKETTVGLRVRLGDELVILVDAFLVYHNTARGPAKGGIRMAANASMQETKDLAARMTWKTALTKIPFGGGKSSIRIDPYPLSPFTKKLTVRRFIHEIRHEVTSGSYVPAPDFGTGPPEMAAIYGELHVTESVTGKPPRVGGLPGREEATGFGVAAATRYALENIVSMDLSEAKVAIQGFGNVGSWTAYFLHRGGAKVVALLDRSGGVYDPNGLDIPAVVEHASKKRTVAGYPAKPIDGNAFWAVRSDVIVPAAIENVINEENAGRLQTRLVVEGANGPTTLNGEKILKDRGIVVIPDILANSGGVVGSYIEWRSGKSGSITPKSEVHDTIEKTIISSFKETIASAESRKLSLREGALVLAIDELVKAMHDRGWV